MSKTKDSFQVFLNYRPLLKHLVGRDFKVKYRRSALGVAWSVLNPLLMMMVQSIVFSYLFRFQIENFPLYLLSAQVLFSFYSDATSTGMDSILYASGLIRKVYIPKYIFPLEKVLFALLNVAFSYVALILVIIFTGGSLSVWMLLFPVPLLIMLVFNFGIALILSALTVFFRDIKHFYSVFVMVINYLTPIFYPEDTLLDPNRNPLIRFVALANPLYWFTKFNRNIFYYRQAPGMLEVLIPCAWAVGLLGLGLLIFKKTQDDFILHI